MRKDLRTEIYGAENILTRVLELIGKDSEIAESNKANIADFVEDGRARGLGSNRLVICIQTLRRLSKLTSKDLKAFTEEDAKALMRNLESSKYSEWTKSTSKKLFKQLMRGYKKPETVWNWIKASTPPNLLKKEDLLTTEEIRRIVSACPDNMWKALISILAESGCRPLEALNLTIENIILNSDHVKLYVSGKTAKKQGERPLHLFKSYDIIQAWLEEHPNKDDLNSPLWVTRRTGQPISIAALGVMFKRIAERAGITKRVFPYLLRHSVATVNYTKYAQPLAMKMLGHSDPAMSKTYVHLAEEDVLEALRQENGLAQKEEEKSEAELCQSCGHQNSYGSIQCNKCKEALGSAGVIKIEAEHDAELKELRELKQVMADPQVAAVLNALKNPEVIAALKEAVK
jgi:integrase/recombinase XerD